MMNLLLFFILRLCVLLAALSSIYIEKNRFSPCVYKFYFIHAQKDLAALSQNCDVEKIQVHFRINGQFLDGGAQRSFAFRSAYYILIFRQNFNTFHRDTFLRNASVKFNNNPNFLLC